MRAIFQERFPGPMGGLRLRRIPGIRRQVDVRIQGLEVENRRWGLAYADSGARRHVGRGSKGGQAGQG
jgi:hypothetical protein